MATKSDQPQMQDKYAKSAGVPLWKSVLAGGVAGVVETALLYPTDVIKTRQQLSKERSTIIGLTKDIYRKEGIPTFYRGIGSPLIGEFIKRGVKFGLNEQFKGWFKRSDGTLSNWGAAGAGACAGFAEAWANCPFEVVKIRMQSPEGKAMYSGTLDCTMKLIKTEGARALYQGIEAQLWRNVTWNSVYFGTIGSMRSIIPKDATPGEQQFYSLVGGFLGGTFASCCNISFDTAKSRIQGQLPGQVRQFNWTLPTVYHIARTEGIRAPFKGLGAKLLRLSPGGAVMSVVFDRVLEALRPY